MGASCLRGVSRVKRISISLASEVFSVDKDFMVPLWPLVVRKFSTRPGSDTRFEVPTYTTSAGKLYRRVGGWVFPSETTNSSTIMLSNELGDTILNAKHTAQGIPPARSPCVSLAPPPAASARYLAQAPSGYAS